MSSDTPKLLDEITNHMSAQRNRIFELESTLRAIKARIQGIWDDPDLMEMGVLDSQAGDILSFIEKVLDDC